jgi:excisionase family DNA binding protein
VVVFEREEDVRRREAEAKQRQHVRIMEACEIVGVSRRTMSNWIAAGKVEYVRTAGGAIRIFADSLLTSPTEGHAAAGVSQLRTLTAERDALRAALVELRINANRLCDRMLGGTYEDDCRRSIAKADEALALADQGHAAERTDK